MFLHVISWFSSMDGRYVVSSIIFTNLCIRVYWYAILSRHVLRIFGRYGYLASDRAWQCSRKCKVVSSPFLHSGHVSAWLLPAVGEVAMGYRCTSRKGLDSGFSYSQRCAEALPHWVQLACEACIYVEEAECCFLFSLLLQVLSPCIVYCLVYQLLLCVFCRRGFRNVASWVQAVLPEKVLDVYSPACRVLVFHRHLARDQLIDKGWIRFGGSVAHVTRVCRVLLIKRLEFYRPYAKYCAITRPSYFPIL